MDTEACEWCGGDADPDTTCPRSISCPSCHARPGARCRRPSGHPAQALHTERVQLAESFDAAPTRADAARAMTAALAAARTAGPSDPDAPPTLF